MNPLFFSFKTPDLSCKKVVSSADKVGKNESKNFSFKILFWALV